MTQRKLTSILVFLGLMLLFTIQLPAQNSRQSSSQTPEKKQMTRAQFSELGVEQQRNLMHDFDLVVITDIVNATIEEARSPQQSVFYYSVDQFNNSSKEKKFELVSHPEMYRIYDSNNTGKNNVVDGVVKSTTITLTELKSLPEEKQKSILESDDFTIIEE